MFMRIDKLLTDLPPAKRADPNAAAALQELLGGKYGEMSTLGNYMFQSFNFRNKTKLKPFYSLVSSIFAEELGHVELVSNGIAMLNNGPGDPTSNKDISTAPYEDMKDIRLAGGFYQQGGGAVPINSNAQSWNVDMVTTTGNLIIDLLHNFHLECGARLHKLRVYETLSDPTGREVCGYLLVRGSLHAHAYALAIKKLTGVQLEQMLPTPNIDLSRIPECQEVSGRGQASPIVHLLAQRLRRSGGRLVERRGGVAGRSAGQSRSRRGCARGRQDGRTGRQLRCVCARLRARGDLRDREQAVSEEPLAA